MTLDPHAIRAVVEGEHGDSFAVLGPHRVQTPDGAALAVRAIVPGATAVRVLPADAPPTPMERLHPWVSSKQCSPTGATRSPTGSSDSERPHHRDRRPYRFPRC